MADIEKLEAMCRSLRDKKSKLTAEYEKQKSTLDQAMALVEQQIRSVMNQAGIKSARTEAGTATLKTTSRYNVKDWDKMYDLMKQEGDMSFLQRRLSTTRLAQYLDDGNDLPEFIGQFDQVDVSITKPAS